MAKKLPTFASLDDITAALNVEAKRLGTDLDGLLRMSNWKKSAVLRAAAKWGVDNRKALEGQNTRQKLEDKSETQAKWSKSVIWKRTRKPLEKCLCILAGMTQEVLRDGYENRAGYLTTFIEQIGAVCEQMSMKPTSPVEAKTIFGKAMKSI